MSENGRFVFNDIAAQTQKLQRLRLGKNLCFIHRRGRKEAIGRVRLQLGQYIPDSGQEHTAHGNDGFFVPTTGFDSAVTFPKLRVFFRANDGVGDLNQ